MIFRLIFAGSLAVLTLGPAFAQADLFRLKGGGEVEGKLLNPDESPRRAYRIQTPIGGTLELAADQVTEVERFSPVHEQYEKLKPSYPNTAAGQWALAQWCRQNRLQEERTEHLKRVIDLDSDHAGARRALGYARFDGKWQTKDEVMRGRGYVQDPAGRWRLPQDLRLQQQRDQQEAAETAWFGKLKRWRGWLATPERAREAQREIAAITDPAAIPALTQYIDDETYADVRKLLVEAMAHIGRPEAMQVLAILSLEDPTEEIRLTCLDSLGTEQRPGVVDFYIQRLKSKENVTVNRAAVGLAHMKDDRAVRPLIEALVTVHKREIQTGVPEGAYSTTFSPSGGSSFGVGGGPRIIREPYMNQAALEALVVLTGGTVNFEYDVRAWKNWYASQQGKPPKVDARRDRQ